MNKQTEQSKGCSTCLFYVNPFPDSFICVAGKKIKTYIREKKSCKNWVENTPENASFELEKLVKDEVPIQPSESNQ